MFKVTILAGLLSALPALCHMQMSSPYPFKSKLNPANGQNVDYSMTSPLTNEAGGVSGPYPCKGYHIGGDMTSQATWEAGSSIQYTLTGANIGDQGARHNGGSCQVLLSYDKGQTWSVIQSHIGGCVLETQGDPVTIPKDAPSGNPLFAWTWFNKSGNREMYMNCAVVTITNGGAGLTDTTKYPAPLVANVKPAENCKTVEGTEVVYPNPGANVIYGGQYAGNGASATPGAGLSGDCGAVAAGSGGAPAGSSDTAASPTAAGGAGQPATTPTDAGVPATTAVAGAGADVPPVVATSPTTAADAPGQTLYTPSTDTIPATQAQAAADPAVTAPDGVTGETKVVGDISKQCMDKRKKQKRSRSPAKRHERLLRRSHHDHLVDRDQPKRVAASKAEHLIHRDVSEREDAPKRVAASKAEHLVHRNVSERDQPKRVAASKAEHLVHRDVSERDQPKRVAASKAEHLVHRDILERDEPKRVAAMKAEHLSH